MQTSRVLNQLRETINKERVLDEEEANGRYGVNTNGIVRKIAGAIIPLNVEEIQQVVKIANNEKIAIYPISTGHNWGYGTALPITDNNIILDLSQMNSILDFDEKLGIVTIEPGVTQQDLYKFLTENNYPYLVPVTGAGPKGGLLGNVLERGFGVTPISDHFAATTSLNAVLPDGSLYTSALEEAGSKAIDRLYKYSVGAYLDGIFTQSNFGIVTSITIALARKPQTTRVVFIKMQNDRQLERVIDALPKLLSSLGSTTQGFKLVNKNQALAMGGGKNKKDPSQKLLPEWLIVCGLFGEKNIVNEAEKIIKRQLKYKMGNIISIDAEWYHKYSPLLKYLPIYSRIKKTVEDFSEVISLFLGIPSSAALPLAYLRSGTLPKNHNDADPGKDGAGLIWFAPLVPLDSKILLKYYKGIQAILKKYDLPELITITTVNERCGDCPIPLVFDKTDSESIKNAKSAYDELWEYSKNMGITPYRLPVDEQWRVVNSSPSAFGLIKKIKDAIDPNHILSPKRYGN